MSPTFMLVPTTTVQRFNSMKICTMPEHRAVILEEDPTMKHQEVSVDYWAMIKTMFTYGALTALCWIMLRLFHTVFTLPRRLRSQQENIQNTLKDLQKRFPDMDITEEDLMNAEKELDELTKENEETSEKPTQIANEKKIPEIVETLEEDKKDI